VVSSQGSATAIRSAYEGLTALLREQAVSSPEAVFAGAQLQRRRAMQYSRELTRLAWVRIIALMIC
jgi:hypothetical protein